MANFNVSLKKLTEKVSLDVVYTPKGLEEINVEIAEVNRPGLFLAGYYDYFDKLRLQILGLAEMNFLSGLSAEKQFKNGFSVFFKANNLLDAKRERYLKTVNNSNLEYEGQKSDKTIVGTYKYGRTFLLGVRYKL